MRRAGRTGLVQVWQRVGPWAKLRGCGHRRVCYITICGSTGVELVKPAQQGNQGSLCQMAPLSAPGGLTTGVQGRRKAGAAALSHSRGISLCVKATPLQCRASKCLSVSGRFSSRVTEEKPRARHPELLTPADGSTHPAVLGVGVPPSTPGAQFGSPLHLRARGRAHLSSLPTAVVRDTWVSRGRKGCFLPVLIINHHQSLNNIPNSY